MKESQYKTYEELPLFLNAAMGDPSKTQRNGFTGERRSSKMSKPCRLRQGEGYGACDDEAKVLSVSPSSGYELMHEKDFPSLRIGNRIIVPKENFQQWVERHTGGADG